VLVIWCMNPLTQLRWPAFFIAILVSLSCHAQKGYWNAVDLSQLGYQRHTFDWQAQYPTDSNYAFQVPRQPGQFSLGHTYLKFEIPARGVYFSSDLSFMSDLFIALVSKNAGEKEVYPGIYPGTKYQMLDVFPMKLAFGGFLTDWLAVYAGGQWAYRGVGTGDYRTSMVFGGNYRGAGLHVMGGPKWLFARYSLMHDWVRRYNRTYKGTALTHEVAVYLAPFKTTAFGFFGRMEYQNTKMEAMLGNPREAGAPLMPAVNCQLLNFGFGVFMEGLVSGTSKAISKTTEGIYGG
jgi:hypothetical protein